MTRSTTPKNSLLLPGDLLIDTVSRHLIEATEVLDHVEGNRLQVNLENVSRIDSAGVAFLDELSARADQKGIAVRLQNIHPDVWEAIEAFSSKEKIIPAKSERKSIFEKIGHSFYHILQKAVESLYLVTDTLYFAAIGLVDRRGRRKGEFLNQSILIGMNAFPIVSLVSFLI